MAKSSSTPIEFNAKAFFIASVMTACLALFCVILTIESGKPAVLILTVFWGAISVICVRSWLAKR
jgi:hypothetical protein